MTYENPFGWTLPETDALLDQAPAAPLEIPAHSIAERLTMLAHLSFNKKVWGGSTQNLPFYWERFGQHLEGSTNNRDVAAWWGAMMDAIQGVPLTNMGLLHEKNLLCHPTTLPNTPVPDQQVMAILRTYNLDLRDRVRVWRKVRRDQFETETIEDQGEL